MKKKLLWITQTAMMLALLICLQWVGSQIPELMTKQLVTGSLVNCVLAVTVLYAGLSSGITLAVCSPVLAYLLTIAPQALTVPAIMVGNTVFVVVLYLLAGRNKWVLSLVGWLGAAAAKFVTLYSIVAWIICGLLAQALSIKPPMAEKLIATFSWPQLVTALVGGGVALLIVPVLKKALRKN